MAYVVERGPFWDGFWHDALGKLHHRSTKVRIYPEGVSGVGQRNSEKSLSKQKAQDLVNKWERADKGAAIPTQDQKVTAEIADRKLPGHGLKNIPSIKEHLVNHLTQKIDGKIEGTTAKICLGHLEAALMFLGPRQELPITTFLTPEIDEYLKYEEQVEGNSTSTVWGRWSFLYEALNTGVGKYFTVNPAEAAKPARPVSSSRRPLEEDELPPLLTAALRYVKGRQWVTAILFSIYLGLRLSDAIRMRWSIINLKKGTADLTQFKLRRFKKLNRVPLHDDLLRWILNIKDDHLGEDALTPDLIKRDTSSLSESYRRILVNSRIDTGAQERLSGLVTHTVVFHSGRFSLATWLNDLAVPDIHIRALLGNCTPKNLHVYSQTRLKGLQRTVAKLPSVAVGVVPLADVTQPLPTSAGSLPDDIHKQFDKVRSLLEKNTDSPIALEEFNVLQIMTQKALRAQKG
jgi:integrase